MARARSPHLAILGTRGYPSYYGGFETLLRHLIPFLVQQGWEVDVYCRPGVKPETSDERVTQIFTRGLEHRSSSTLTYGLTSAIDAARRTPDVALVMNVANGFWLPVLKARGIPTVVNVDGIEWERDKWGRGARAVFRRGARVTARYADELIVDSAEIGHRWDCDFGRSGSFIPYGGLADDVVDALPEHPRGTYALYIARFVPENSIDEFVDAADKITTVADVVIVGCSGYGGPIDDRVQALAAANPRVSWLGHIHDDARLRALWANAGAYFHGHSVGGTNPALVQAMACASPVVARDTCYNREVLGNAAVFVPPDPDAIATEMMRLLADRTVAEDVGRRGRERQRLHYTWDKVCHDYHRLLASKLQPENRSAVGA